MNTWTKQGDAWILRSSKGQYEVRRGANGRAILWWQDVTAAQARVVQGPAGGGYFVSEAEACAAAEASEGCPCAAEGCPCSHTHPPSVPTGPCPAPAPAAAQEKRPTSTAGYVNRLDFATDAEAQRVARSLRRRSSAPQHVFGSALYTNASSADIAAAVKATKVRPTFQSIGGMHEAGEEALVIHEPGTANAPGVHEASEFAQVTRDPVQFEAMMARSRAIGPLENSDLIYKFLKKDLAKQDQEVFVVVPLDLHYHLRAPAPVEVARGGRKSVAVMAIDVLRAGVSTGAEMIVVAHNHPSGLVKPSDKDLELTSAIIDGCKRVGLVCKDHLIIGTTRYYSIREHHEGLWK